MTSLAAPKCNVRRRVNGRWSAIGIVVVLICMPTIDLAAQTAKPTTRKPPTQRRPAPVVRTTQAPADITCPAPLGVGLRTKARYCDVLTGRDPQQGVLIKFPPHRGTLTLRFDLHNRHTYSEEEVRLKRAYAAHTSTIGVLTMDNTLLTRAVMASEFRSRNDLLERVGGGAGPGGVKAVAPIGVEPISVVIPADTAEVSLLGEKLTVVGYDGVSATYSAPGRPIAVISNVTVEYTAAPPPSRRK
jgi:hypothetical protein